MKLTLVLFSFVLIILLNSCGVITKTRYGNGFKLNIESNLFSKGDDKKTPKSKKPVKTKDVDGKTEVKIGTNKIETNDAIDFNDAPSEPEIVQNPHSVASRKILKKSKVELNEKIHVSSPEEKSLNAERKPIEPVTKTAAYLFYGSLALLLIITQLGIYIPIYGTILVILIIAGGILAEIGRRRIKRNRDIYRGKWLAISIIIIYFSALLYISSQAMLILFLMMIFR